MEVHQIHPVFVPQKHGDWKQMMAQIATDKEIIVHNPEKQEYTFLKEADLFRCRKNTAERHLICLHETPFMNGLTKSSCEYKLLTDPTKEELKKCPINTKREQENTFLRLRTMDAWLYSTSRPTKVNVACIEGNPRMIHIEGVGILQIEPGCWATIEDTRIWGSPIIETKALTYHSPKISFKR